MNILETAYKNPKEEHLAKMYFSSIKEWQQMKKSGRSQKDLEKANWKIGQIKKLLQKKATR